MYVRKRHFGLLQGLLTPPLIYVDEIYVDK